MRILFIIILVIEKFDILNEFYDILYMVICKVEVYTVFF